jgi:hypothetical protein
VLIAMIKNSPVEAAATGLRRIRPSLWGKSPDSSQPAIIKVEDTLNSAFENEMENKSPITPHRAKVSIRF